MTARRRVSGIVLGLLMVFNTACYSFVPLASGVAPKAGDQVRVRFNAEGTSAMTSVLGPGVVMAEGTLSAANADGSVVVGVGSIQMTDGSDRFWNGQNVITVPANYIAGLDLRTVDRQKTRAASIGAALAIVAIFALALSTGGAHGDASPGDTQPPP